MMVNFYEAFGNNADADNEIPQEILEELNKELPQNLVYIKDKNGKYYIVPRPDREVKTMKMTTKFDLDPEKDELLINKLRTISREKWGEYLYRTQRSIAVKDIKIGNDEQLIPLEQTMANPLSDVDIIVKECRMYPEEFPDPTPMIFESEEGDKICINFQQEAYDSLTEIKIHNVDFPALKIELFIYSPLTDVNEETAKTNEDNRISITYSITPTKASSSTVALIALRIFKGLFTGKTKVNGQVMISTSTQAKFDPQRVDDALQFWSTAVILEKKLGVSFNPSADFPMEDVKFFSELDACLNEKKKIVWKHPFDHFHVNRYHPQTEEETMDSLIGKEKMSFTFIEGPIPCTLLGTEFDIYSFSEMEELVITNIEWDDEEKQSGEVYVTDAPGKTWTLSRLYMIKEDADRLKEQQETGMSVTGAGE